MTVNRKDSAKKNSRRKTWLRRIIELIMVVGVFWFTFNATAKVLREVAIIQISEMTGSHVEAGHVYFRINGSVFVQNIAIRPVTDPGYDNAFFKADKLYARFGILSLLRFKPQLKKIKVSNFVLDAQNETDTDRWNFMDFKLTTSKGPAGKLPIIRLKGGILRYSKITDGISETALEVPLEVKLDRDKTAKDNYNFYITTAQRPGYEKPSNLNGKIGPGIFTVSGSLSSSELPAFKNPWSIDTLAMAVNYDDDKNFNLNLTIRDLRNQPIEGPVKETIDSKKLLKRFGTIGAIHNVFARFNPSGQLDLGIKAKGNFDDLKNVKVQGSVNCNGINFYDIKYPYELNNLTGKIDFTHNSILLNSLTAEHDDIDLRIEGQILQKTQGWDYDVKLLSDNMMLNEELFAILSPSQKKLWNAFDPYGRAGIEFSFKKQPGKDKQQRLTVDLKSIRAKCKYFPYPIKNLYGQLVFDPSEVFVYSLVSEVGNRKLTFDGHLTGTNTRTPKYDITIKATNIDLDSDLANALPDGQRYLYDKFVAGGMGDALIKVFNPTDGTRRITFLAELFFKNVIFEVNKSLVKISDISGKAVFTPDTITLDNIEGIANAQGSIDLNGKIWPGKGADELRYDMSVAGKNTLLEKSLFDLMPKSMEKFISVLQPSGNIDFRAKLKKLKIEDTPEYNLIVDCQGSSINFKPFPYPLKDIFGTIDVSEDIIKLKNVRANTVGGIKNTQQTHQIFANGQIELSEKVFKSAQFSLDANGLMFDQRLKLAIPEKFKKLYDKFSPTGRFSLDVPKLNIITDVDKKKIFDIEGSLKLNACSFTPEKSVSDLDSLIKMKVLYHHGRGILNADASINAQSLKVKGKELTNMHAKVDFDPDQKLWSAEDVIADCYDGRFTGGFKFKQIEESPWQYYIDVAFGNINLHELISKQSDQPGNSYSTGILGGSAALQGTIGNDQTRIGRCSIVITDMKVGKLSPIANVLQILKLDDPTDYAFERLFASSYIEKNTLNIDRIDLAGESIAFNGSGKADIKTKDINLKLAVRGKRIATADPSVLQSLAEELGSAVLRVDVTGTYDAPKVNAKPLPVLEHTLEVISPNEKTEK